MELHSLVCTCFLFFGCGYCLSFFLFSSFFSFFLDKKHRWVNAENMLRKVMVGVLIH